MWIGLTKTGFVAWLGHRRWHWVRPNTRTSRPAWSAELRSVCLGLPETVEKQVWAGTQWRIRDRMFAHVLAIDFADGPVTVMTFRSSGPELDALRSAGLPFFRPAWGANLVGMVLDAGINWDEVTELLIESYCVLAPRKLVEQIHRPRIGARWCPR